MARGPAPRDIDEYIGAFPPDIRAILARIRSTIRKAAPEAKERISYGIPAFTLDGGDLIDFAAFKNHISIYPPVKGDEELRKAISRYAGERGNLKFSLNEPIPYTLLGRFTKFRMKEHRARRASKQAKKRQ